MYDYLVVGAGIFGATMARSLSDAGKRVLVIDRRSEIGGTLFTERVDGVLIHRHGPHILHTNNREIWDFLKRFTKIIPYRHRAKSLRHGVLYSFPINLHTLNQRWGVRTPQEALEALQRVRIARPGEARDLESWVKSQIGEELYELFYEHYTRKQWGRAPSEIPEGVAHRLPIRTDANDEYFDDGYQGLPENGFTPMIQEMLSDSDVRLQADFLADRSFWNSQATTIIYSGSLDALYDYDLGRLEYRSLKLTTEIHSDSFQGCPTVNYPGPHTPWTRITEFNYYPPNRPGGPTVIMKEHPEPYDGRNEPYYPINDARNTRLARAYLERARIDGYVVGGRLGSYRYYDIHHVIAQAQKIAQILTRDGPRASVIDEVLLHT
jgi:UDP-galactopyranose mutase